MKAKVSTRKGTPQKTLMFPLYGRYRANQTRPQLFKDTAAKEIFDSIDYDIGQVRPQEVAGDRHRLPVRVSEPAGRPRGIHGHPGHPDGILPDRAGGLRPVVCCHRQAGRESAAQGRGMSGPQST